jgi:XTP/dITP diphosphohydrolase
VTVGGAGAPPIVLATRNEGKLRELRALFREFGLEVTDLAGAGLGAEHPGESEVEAYDSFVENAIAKARFFHHATGGRACAADDSGLEVSALGGAPGVHSRRWAAEPGLGGAAQDSANNARLLRELEGAPDRSARFVCAAAYCDGSRTLVRLGTLDGSITAAPRGVHGFGYDAYFESAALGITLAEASLAEKQRVSHRAQAFRALVAALGTLRS